MTLELHEPNGATPLTPDELLGLKAKHIATRGELNELEGENIIAGLTWLDRRPKSFDVLTDAAVREIHKRLFGEVWDWAGGRPKRASTHRGRRATQTRSLARLP